MSSAKNHAKRSHRSEHAKRSAIGSSARKMRVRQARKPQPLWFFENLIRGPRKTKDITK